MGKLDQDKLGCLAINTVVRTLYAKLKGSFNSTNFEMDAKGCDVYVYVVRWKEASINPSL